MNVKIDLYLILSIVILFAFNKAEIFLTFYVFVALHELSHILVALCLKISVKEVTLLPFGINAKFEFDKKYKKEIIVAMAGPIMSFALAYYFPTYRLINMFIGIMNLLPIYPLDGGRIIKNTLILVLGMEKAITKYRTFLRIVTILFLIINIIMIIYLKRYQFIFVTLYLFQMVEEELKKDRVRMKMKEILNLEV